MTNFLANQIKSIIRNISKMNPFVEISQLTLRHPLISQLPKFFAGDIYNSLTRQCRASCLIYIPNWKRQLQKIAPLNRNII